MEECERLGFRIEAEKVELVEGITGTGKTHRLLRRLDELLAADIDPASILVVGATRQACAALERRSRRTAPPFAGPPFILTCTEVESWALGSAKGRLATGRHHRIVKGIDRSIFDQDLETTGIPLDIIARSMEKILHGWAQADPVLTDEDAITVREELLLCLEDLDAMMEEEAHYLAASVVLAGRLDRRLKGVRHVLVDDFQKLCRASRIFVAGLARDSLFLAADSGELRFIATADGPKDPLQEVSELLGAPIRTLGPCHRSDAIAGGLRRLLDAQGDSEGAQDVLAAEGSAKGAIEVRAYASPKEEVLGIAELAGGLARASGRPASVAIACANGIWKTNVERALDLLGIAYRDLDGDAPASAEEHADEDELIEELASHLGDGLLWRRWCARGDALANSSFFARCRHARPRRALSETLLHLTENEAPQPSTALEEKHEHAVRERVEQVRERLRVDADPSGAASTVHGRDGERRRSSSSDDVAPIPTLVVGSLGSFDGLAPDTVILVGVACGALLPKACFDPAGMEDPERQCCRSAARKALYGSLGKAAERAIVSFSERADLAEVRALGLKTDRIELRDGRRTARLSLDEALADFLDPVSFSGSSAK